MIGQLKKSEILRSGLRVCRSHTWALAAIALCLFMLVVIFSGIGRNGLVRDAAIVIVGVSARAIYKGSRRSRALDHD